MNPDHEPRHALSAAGDTHRVRHHRVWAIAVGAVALPLTVAGVVATNWNTWFPAPAPSTSPSATGSSATTTGSASSNAATAQPMSVKTVMAPGMANKPQTGGVRYTPSVTGPLTGKVIVVDPGHTGKYSATINMKSVYMYEAGWRPCAQGGAISLRGTSEPELAFKIATKTTRALLEQGATVVQTRADDASYGPCNNERAEIANREKADLLVSIHFDSVLQATKRGVHVIWSDRMMGGPAVEKASEDAAHTMLKSLASGAKLPTSNYANPSGVAVVIHHELGALNGVKVGPAILVEAGNISQKDDDDYVESEAGQVELGRAIANGAAAIVNKPSQPSPAPSSAARQPSAPAASPASQAASPASQAATQGAPPAASTAPTKR